MSREAFTVALLVGLAMELPAAEPVRLDRFGDPLPAGAVFRLGTLRFRPPSGDFKFAASSDAKTFATGEGSRITLWDATSGKQRWTSQLPKGVTCDKLEFSPNGTRLMAIGWRHDRRPDEFHPLFLFDADSGEIVGGLQPPKSSLSTYDWRFLLDGRYFLTQEEPPTPAGEIKQVQFGGFGTWPRDTVPIVWDLEAGKEISRLPVSTNLIVSENGRTLALTFKNCIHLWDVASRKTINEIQCAKAEFERVTFSADGKTLAAIRITSLQQDDRGRSKSRAELVCWDVASGKELLVWRTRPESFALSRDGTWLATMDERSRMATRSVKTGKEVVGSWLFDNLVMAVMPEPDDRWQGDLMFAPDGRLLVRDRFHGFRQFDVASGRCLRRSAEESFDLSGDRKAIITLNYVGFFRGPSIFIRDAGTGKDRAGLGQHGNPVTDLVLTKDKKLLASRDSAGGLRVWNMATGEQLPTPLPKGCAPIPAGCFGFLEDGRRIVAVAEDGVVHVWEPRSGKVVQRFGIADSAMRRDRLSASYHFDKEKNWLSLAHDKRTVAMAGFHRVAAWDVVGGRQLAPVRDIEPYIERIELAADGKAMVIDADKHSLIRTVDGSLQATIIANELEGARICTPHTAMSADGKWLARAYRKSLTVFQVNPLKEIWSTPRQADAAHPNRPDLSQWCGFTADSRHVAAISDDETIILYDALTGKESQRTKRPDEQADIWLDMHPINGLSWSGGPNPYVCDFRLFHAQQGQWPPTYQNNREYVSSHDGHLFAYCRGEDVTLIESRTGSRIGRFQAAPNGDVNCLLFGGNDQTLITGNSDSSVMVWDWAAAANLKPEPRRRPDAATWDALGSDDAGKGYRAIFALLADPLEGTRLLRESLKPATKEELARIPTWIADLDDDQFAVRNRAKKALLNMGEDALPDLKVALKRPRSTETEQSLRGLIVLAESGKPSGEIARQIRAIQALEWMDTPEARQMLSELANGEPNVLRTKEAGQALRRNRAK